MNNRWTEDQLLLTLHLYCRTPFGKLHSTNPEVIALANIIGRTPSAVAMKACNFASLDPALSQKGLYGASQVDKNLWQQFLDNPTEIAERAEALYEVNVFQLSKKIQQAKFLKMPLTSTETTKEVKVRRVQQFFRKVVLDSYNYKCAISGLAITEMLVASHIIPWCQKESTRADPANGILLNVLYDKAFDKGFISLDNNLKIIISDQLKEKEQSTYIREQFLALEGIEVAMPYRFLPKIEYLKFHREFVFKSLRVN